jgi:energy-coupling factor transporter ATP-binding protein EcfA2
MTVNYIKRMIVKSFSPLTGLDIELTPLHAFIGPNDSGKSTLLRVVQTVMDIAIKNEAHATTNPRFRFCPHEVEIFFSFTDLSYKETCSSSTIDESLMEGDVSRFEVQSPLVPPEPHLPLSSITQKAPPDLTNFLFNGTRFIKWDPDTLRQESRLIPSSEHLDIKDERGQGLSGIYDAILKRGDDAYKNISDDIRKLFPVVKTIQLKNTPGNTVALKIELNDSSEIQARLLSDGILYYLAFAALKFLKPASVLLIEEPENGLHPARIKEVMQILRSISESTQVIMATHSPLVINEMEGNEVTVVTRHKSKGTKATRMDKTPNFEERSKIYALGELWVSYADGTCEEQLLNKPDDL